MLSSVHYEVALNYFYFLLLDEGAALNCALQTIRVYQKIEKTIEAKDSDRVLISELSKTLKKAKKKKFVPKGNPPKSDWKPSNIEAFAAWKAYLRNSEPDAAEAMVLRYILNYSIKIISEGLQIPEGTILYRLGRGLESFSAVQDGE